MRSARIFVAIGVLLLSAPGCGGKASVNQAGPPCETRVVAAHPADTLTVVVFGEINPLHAPWGQNREERFVFSHLYETLVNIDCGGVVRPGVAKSWKPGSDGWLVELRDGAQFWDQTKVSAEDVVRSFEAAIKAGLAISSVDPVDEHTVLIKGMHGPPDIKLLALPMVAIRESGTSGPAIGTGAWQFDNDIPFAEAVAIEPVVGSLGPVVRFVQANPSDAKDLVAGKADAMITDDAVAIDYARGRHAIMTPLAWDRAYVLVSMSRARSLREGAFPDYFPSSVGAALARDAVSNDARGGDSLWNASRSAFPGSVLIQVGSDATTTSAPALSSRVVYLRGDKTARELSERIVALAAMDTASIPEARAFSRAVPYAKAGLRAIGLSEAEMSTALERGEDFGCVLCLSSDWDLPFVTDHLYKTARGWLRSDLPIVPLVEIRAHFIALNDRAGFTHDETGNVRFLISEPERKR